ncbi:uncharacterized protein B0H18DRAFT_984602 [Fomitopsis serialis]|uniref:uncharacterized protein n=1 Tax=Fomitopsis serialis TaxID=139415 RepID=UPI0020089F2D|nr:uncharacterized protein B0H18DRAFT_984602 [Neoantrodia serialis]KAH9932913.1 hypothetical protein B0H18DRAFT_984602 [Neoantrodia serialis]
MVRCHGHPHLVDMPACSSSLRLSARLAIRAGQCRWSASRSPPGRRRRRWTSTARDVRTASNARTRGYRLGCISRRSSRGWLLTPSPPEHRSAMLKSGRADDLRASCRRLFSRELSLLPGRCRHGVFGLVSSLAIARSYAGIVALPTSSPEPAGRAGIGQQASLTRGLSARVAQRIRACAHEMTCAPLRDLLPIVQHPRTGRLACREPRSR